MNDPRVSRALWARTILLIVLVAWVNAVSVAWAGEPTTLEPGTDGVQRATIILDSYSYSPDRLIVLAGKPVELTLTSVTTITPHNFIIKELAVEQDVGAGKTVTVRFTPMQPGVYLFYCDKKLLFLPSHREKGMEGRLEVR
ncbi:MAG: quinol oxidase [Nitrospira sp.]|nr:quinol oxidase [Nitrospira sp.]